MVGRDGEPRSPEAGADCGSLAETLALGRAVGQVLRPGDVLDLLGIGDWIQSGATITRTRVVLQSEFASDDPQLVASAEETSPSSSGDCASNQASGETVDARS